MTANIKEDNRLFAIRLKNTRKLRKMTQSYLADKLHTTRNAVSNWERGTSRPTVQNTLDLATILDVEPSYLFVDRHGDISDRDMPIILDKDLNSSNSVIFEGYDLTADQLEDVKQYLRFLTITGKDKNSDETSKRNDN